jgi:hypothetical protein
VVNAGFLNIFIFNKNFLKPMKKIRFVVLICFTFFLLSCSEERPKLKIINESMTKINANFIAKECACPVFSINDIYPFNETEYRTCSAIEYTIMFSDSLSKVESYFYPELDKKYDIYFNGSSCSIISSNQ